MTASLSGLYELVDQGSSLQDKQSIVTRWSSFHRRLYQVQLWKQSMIETRSILILEQDDSVHRRAESCLCLRAPLKTYQDRDEYNFDFEQGDSAHRRAVSPSYADQRSSETKVRRSDRLAACCALAALLSPRQGFQPNRWRESLACITANRQSRHKGGFQRMPLSQFGSKTLPRAKRLSARAKARGTCSSSCFDFHVVIAVNQNSRPVLTFQMGIKSYKWKLYSLWNQCIDHQFQSSYSSYWL